MVKICIYFLSLLAAFIIARLGLISPIVPTVLFNSWLYLFTGEKAGIKWIDTLSLPSNTRDFDMENIKLQNAEFKQLQLKKINLTLRLETSAVCIK